ncbi:MAG: hypothetical protein ACI3ZN_05240 [Candidatus Cryptobacteroides sp.]
MTLSKSFFSNLLAIASLAIFIFLAANCGKQVEEQLNALLDIPEEITVDASTMQMSLRIVSNFAPAATDRLELVSTGGTVTSV